MIVPSEAPQGNMPSRRLTQTPADTEQEQGAVEQFWDAKPCDSDMSDKELYSKEYFREIQESRYQLQSHILDLLSSLDLDRKRVLEIGAGVGTDARTIIDLGADYTGINVDAGSCNMTRRALEAFGLSGEVRHASALDIPYPHETFDIVYSFGVLHHIPDADQAVKEILRVLKPGGRLVIMLYNKTSINYMVEIQRLRKWGLRVLGLPGILSLLRRLSLPKTKLQRHLDLRKSIGTMSDEEWLSRNTDGPENPYSRVYDRMETEDLLSGFHEVDQYVRFFDYRHWGAIGRLIPTTARYALGARWGWHRIAIARKVRIPDES
jgi:ubiquinone/menaquinone biosynthesis C-methylase UbiE